MASSGSFNSSSYSNRNVLFSWSTYERSIVGNYTTIYWELKGAGSHPEWFKSGPFTVVIDGETVYNSSTRIQLDNGTLVASGYKTIYHNNDGSRYFEVSVSAAIYTYAVNCSGYGGWWLDSIPRKATFKSPEAYDFNDESSPTIYFNHPAGSALELQARITCNGEAITTWRIIDAASIAKGEYTFPVADFQSAIWNKTIQNQSTYVDVTFELATWLGNYFDYTISSPKRCRLINYKPTVYPIVQDTGSVSTTLTNDSRTMIRGYNVMRAYIGGLPAKGATITERTVTCGSITKKADIYDEEMGAYFADFAYVYDNVFTCKVKDNRGCTNEEPITVPAIDYVPVTCDISYETEIVSDNISNILVTLSGDYYNGAFGDTAIGASSNQIWLEYRYRKSTEAFPVDEDGTALWETIEAESLSMSNNKYTAVFSIDEIDYKDTYIIQAQVFDAIHGEVGVPAKEQTVTVTPVFDWGAEDFNFNVPVFKEGNPIGYYPIGGIYTSTDDTDPGTLFGGTWQLLRTFYGGELVAYGTAWNSSSRNVEFVDDTYYGISDILVGSVYTDSIHNYIPDILTGSSGTIWVQTKGIVGLVEANVEISGSTANSGCYGIWFNQYNKNTLPSSVSLNGGGTLHAMNGYYSGNSTRYFYNIADSDSGTNFYVNPQWTPYGGSFWPCHSGTRTVLQVKAFAKGDTTYMWKRIA